MSFVQHRCLVCPWLGKGREGDGGNIGGREYVPFRSVFSVLSCRPWSFCGGSKGADKDGEEDAGEEEEASSIGV